MSERPAPRATGRLETSLRVAGIVMLLCVPLVKRLRRRLAHLRALIGEEESRIWISAIDDQGSLLAEGGIVLLELAHELRRAQVANTRPGW